MRYLNFFGIPVYRYIVIPTLLISALAFAQSDFDAANAAYADISGSPSARDYVFCTDGIYYGGVKIVST